MKQTLKKKSSMFTFGFREKVMSKLSKFLKDVGNLPGKIIPHTTAAERRATMGAAKEQMDFYHEQKDALHKQNEELSQQKHAEQQKINEKQIRALRRNYRSPGFMDSDINSIQEKLG